MCSQTWYSNPYRYVRDTLSALSKNEYKRMTRILVGRFLRQDFSIFTPIFYAVPLSCIHLFLQKEKKQSILIDLIIFPKKSLFFFEGSFIISWKIIRDEDWIRETGEIDLRATRNSTATGLTGSLDDNNSRIIIHFGKQHLRFDKLCWFIPLIDFIQSYPTLDEIVKKVNSTNQPYPLSSSLEIISLSFEIKNTDCFPPLSPLLSSRIPIKS